MLKKYLVFLSFALVFLMSTSLFAQDNGGQGPDAPSGGPPGGPTNPIDGGLGILLAIGVGYAVKKLRKED